MLSLLQVTKDNIRPTTEDSCEYQASQTTATMIKGNTKTTVGESKINKQ